MNVNNKLDVKQVFTENVILIYETCETFAYLE